MNYRMLFFPLCVAAAGLCSAPLSLAADTADGKALYESRCDACHDKSVHSRAARKAKNFEEIRRWVAHWNRELGSAWKQDEIDAVTRYLNDRYYSFPCPASACRDNKAEAQRAIGAPS